MQLDDHADQDGPEVGSTHLKTEERVSIADQVAPHVLDSVMKSIKRQLWLVIALAGVFGATIVGAGRYYLKEAVDDRIDEEATEFQTKFKKVKGMVNDASVELGVVKRDFEDLQEMLAPTDEKAEDAKRKAEEAGESVASFEARLEKLSERGERLTKDIEKLEEVRSSLDTEVREFRKELADLQEESRKLMVARLDRNLRLLRTRSAMPHVVKNAVAETAEYAQTRRLGDRREEAFGLLLEDLRDRLLDRSIRAEAAWALGAFGEKAIEPLMAVAEDREELLAVRVAATRALSAVGPPAKNTLLSKLHGWKEPEGEEEFREGKEIRAALVVALATIDDEGLLDAVRWALDKKDVEVLWSQIGKPAVPLLVEALRTGPSETQAFALKALIKLGEAHIDASGAIDVLLTTLEEDVLPSHRAAAAEALGEIGMLPDRVVPRLLERSRSDPDPLVVMESIRSLGRFGAAASPAVDYLLQVFGGSATGSSSPEVAQAAALALGQIASKSDTRVTEALAEVAGQNDHPLQRDAEFALAHMR